MPLLHHHLIADPLFFLFKFKEASVRYRQDQTNMITKRNLGENAPMLSGWQFSMQCQQL
jgi:hypothetical protein